MRPISARQQVLSAEPGLRARSRAYQSGQRGAGETEERQHLQRPGELRWAAFLGARRRLIVDIIEGAQLTADFPDFLDTDELAAMLLAMEDGFRLHQLIDPATTPEDSFLRSLAVLQRVFERSSQ
jgi:hypothetical protein